MKAYADFKQWLIGLDSKTLYKYSGLFLACIVLSFVIVFYFYTSRRDDALRKIQATNARRQEIYNLIARSTTVKKQQHDVEALLTKDKNFLIAQFFKNVLGDIQLDSYSTKIPEVTEEDLDQDYVQIKLSASLSGINMRQLTDLLYKIEQNPRVFITELDIVKNNKASAIDCNIVISTLQPKSPTVTE